MCDREVPVCNRTATGNPTTLNWIYEGPEGVKEPTADEWSLSGSVCEGGEEGVEGNEVPVITAEEFRRLPLPAGVVHVQPGTGRTLVNVPTNVYVEAPVIIVPTTVLGRAIQVRATAELFEWNFGDGEQLRTADPGAPYPDLRTTHSYRMPGVVDVELTTVYRGEFSVSGGPWQPIDGTASVTGRPVILTVIAAQAVLVAEPTA